MPCRPWSRTSRATSSSGTPGWRPASLMTIGRLTPVTTSTSPCWRNIEAMLVGVPPNMSVIKSTPPPSETRSMARRISFLAASTSSCQPMETAVMCLKFPMMVSAADSSSFATCPCDTMTPATRPAAPSSLTLSGISQLRLSRLEGFSPPARLPLLRLAHVAVDGRRLVAAAAEVARDPVGRHHGAVAAARAADADGDVGLALAPVEREQVVDEFREAPERLAHLVARVEEAHDARVVPRQLAQLRHEVRVRQMSYVKQQINVVRRAVLVAEAVDLHAHPRAAALRAEALDEEAAERVHGVLGGVDDLVGELPDLGHRVALAADGFEQAVAGVGRVRAARLAEAAHERLVRRLEEEDEDAQARGAQLLQTFGELAEEATLADVHDERGALDVRAVVVFGLHETAEGRHQRQRQVVHAEVAEVFERVRRRRHPRAAQPRDDDNVGRALRRRAADALALLPLLSHPPPLRDAGSRRASPRNSRPHCNRAGA